MSSRYQAGGMGFSSDKATHAFLEPALALSMWNPFLAATLKGNDLAREEFGAIANEWQGFVGHRVQEDITLMQRLAQCRTPDQMAAAYGDFWQKAVEDYGKEFSAMTKLMTGATNKMVMAVQSATDQASANLSPRRKAA